MTSASAPATMRAIGQVTFGTSDVLQDFDKVVTPQPEARDVQVRVVASSINPVDAKYRAGMKAVAPRPLTPQDPQILGFDAAGVVTAVGSEVHKFKVGDQVYFSGGTNKNLNGAHAEYTVVDERVVAHKPRSLDFLQAAAVPLVGVTAWEGFVECLHLEPGVRPGKTVLVIGGAGGVGSIAIQLARKVLGMTVIATASRPETEAWARKMGAVYVIDHKKPMLEQVKALGFAGVNYIYNTADVDNSIAQWGDLLLPLGGVVSILPPMKVQPNYMLFFVKRLTLTFEMMFTRPNFKVDIHHQGEILEKLASLYDSGALLPINTETMDLWTQFKDIYHKIESGTTIGKTVITVQPL